MSVQFGCVPFLRVTLFRRGLCPVDDFFYMLPAAGESFDAKSALRRLWGRLHSLLKLIEFLVLPSVRIASFAAERPARNSEDRSGPAPIPLSLIRPSRKRVASAAASTMTQCCAFQTYSSNGAHC
jgi:hypothetical protein